MFARKIQRVLLGIFVSFICFAGQNVSRTIELTIQSEAKFSDLLRGQSEEDKHEASGVLFLNK